MAGAGINNMKQKTQFVNSGACAEFTSHTNGVQAEDGWMHIAPVGDFEGIASEPDGRMARAVTLS